MIDPSSRKGKRVLKRLEEELVVWLATGGDRPQSVPVWFLWEDGGFLIYSVPGKKVNAVREHPNVHLNFNSTPAGGDVVRFTGRAEVVEGHPPATSNKAFIDKYAEQIDSLGMTAQGFAEEYSVAIRVRPDRIIS